MRTSLFLIAWTLATVFETFAESPTLENIAVCVFGAMIALDIAEVVKS
jgi:hypothetical protein